MLKITKSKYTLILLSFLVFVLQNGLYGEAKFQQQTEYDLISMEAENYSEMNEIVDTYWDAVTEPEDYSGTGGMQAQPAGEERHKDITDAQYNAPTLEYTVDFISTEPLYLWVRASHVDGYDDSVWFGLDDEIEGTAPIQFMVAEQEYANVWFWISHLMNDNDDRAVLQVPSTGEHIFKLYMREPSFRVDKIVLTSDESYRPDDEDDKGPPETLAGGTDVAASKAGIPQRIQLNQNYPNPFNPITTIKYSLTKSDFVTIKVFNLAGQEIARLANHTFQSAGDHQITWSAEGFPSGIYFYSLQASEFSQTMKLILQK